MMMKSLLVVIAVVFAIVGSIESTDVAICGNPLFRRCSGNFFCDVPFLPAPQTRPNTGVCPEIPAGGSTCCSQIVYSAISNAWATGQREIQASVDSLVIARNELSIFLDEYQKLINNISNAYPQLTDQQKSDLTSAYQSILDATRTFFNVAVGDWANCARTLLNYWAGLMCFGCNSHWDLYVRYNNETDRYTVILDKTTCTDMTGQCVPFFQDISNYAVAVVNAAEKIVQTLLTGSGASYEAVPVRDVCHGDCPQYICYSFMIGLNFENPFSKTGDSSSLEDSSHHGSGSGTARKREFTAEDARGTIAEAMNRGKAGLGSEFVHHVQKLENALKNAHDVNERMSRQLFNEKRDSGIVSGNSYEDGGYPATTYGKSSGLDTNVNGAASSIVSWVSYFL